MSRKIPIAILTMRRVLALRALGSLPQNIVRAIFRKVFPSSAAILSYLKAMPPKKLNLEPQFDLDEKLVKFILSSKQAVLYRFAFTVDDSTEYRTLLGVPWLQSRADLLSLEHTIEIKEHSSGVNFALRVKKPQGWYIELGPREAIQGPRRDVVHLGKVRRL